MLRSIQKPLNWAAAASRCARLTAASGLECTPYFRWFSNSSNNHDDNTIKPLLLHTEWVSSTHDHPKNFSILFLHGLLGSGRNLKTLARHVVKLQQQTSGGILMDLRGHGKSFAMTSGATSTTTTAETPRCFTFQHCVDDVEHTLQELYRERKDETAMGPTKVVVGHSFGGRLALEYVAAAGASGEPLEALWLLDTVPGQAHESVDQVLAAVTDIVGKNRPIERNELVQVLTETYGMDKGVAQWLGSSYNAKTGDFGFDLRLVRDLKPEFANQDFVGLLRSILETNSTEAATVVHLVRGGKNGAWSVPVLAELEALAKEFPQTFHMYVLPTAGHWVHVDDLPGLVHLFDKHS